RDSINIDTTRPAISVDLSPQPNAAGFVSGPVTAHFTCTDPLSGVLSCPPDRIVSAEGAAQTVVGTATDNAGNTASVTSAAFGIDVTAPTINVSISPSANANGWNNTPVTAHFTCADAGAGVATCPPDQLISSNGGNQTVNGTVVDAAGNSAS